MSKASIQAAAAKKRAAKAASSSGPKKVISSFTNTSGQKVTSYSDGTKTVSGGSSSSGSTSSPSSSGGGSSPATPAQIAQLAQLKTTLQSLQSKPTSPGAAVNAGYAQALAEKNAPTTSSSTPTSSGAAINAGYAQALAEKNKLDTSQAIPSTALNSGASPQDVLAKRASIEQKQLQVTSLQEQLAELQRVSQLDSTVLGNTDTKKKGAPIKTENPLTNSDQFLNNYFTQDQAKTQAELERDKLLGDVSSSTEDFYKNRDVKIEGAYDKYGVGTKQEALAGLQKEMAERQVRLRKEIQNLETAPEFRGVSREFAIDQREAIKSQGAFDLSNLAIVESAYNGDLTQARSLAQDLIDNQFEAFTGEMETYKAQLAALMPQLNEDQKKQALAIEVALDQRARAIEERKADTELKYEYATAVAKLGAPLSVTKSIIKANSADEAFMLAAPYMKNTATSTTGGTGTRAPSTALGQVFGVNQVSNPAEGLSPFNTPLSSTNLTKAKDRDLETAVRSQFAPDFSTKLFSVLTGEQLRDFMVKYDAFQRSVGQNVNPEDALNDYLKIIGKSPTSGGSSGGGDVYSEIDSLYQ